MSDPSTATRRRGRSITTTTLSDALDNIVKYYARNHLRANLEKTQTCVFHIRNREANRKLNISWCSKELEHTPTPTYLGVILDRTLSYSIHIAKVKGNTAARNNVLKKLSNSKWGANPDIIRTAALALGYSTEEYACPVWERSAHTHKVSVVLNDACRSITGCLQSSKNDTLCLLAGIVLPAIRSVAIQRERGSQVNDTRHPLHGHTVPKKRLKSRSSFMHDTDELIDSPSTQRISGCSPITYSL